MQLLEVTEKEKKEIRVLQTFKIPISCVYTVEWSTILLQSSIKQVVNKKIG